MTISSGKDTEKCGHEGTRTSFLQSGGRLNEIKLLRWWAFAFFCYLCTMPAAGIGRWLDRFGIRRYNVFGFCVMLAAWAVLLFLGNSYAGLVIGIILADVGQQFVGLANQSSALAIDPHASNRINTIYMTIYFIGGSIGTLLAGIGWRHLGWSGVAMAGSMLVLAGLGSMLLKKNNVAQWMAK